MKKNILITGSEGFVGTSLQKKLKKNNFNTILIDRIDSDKASYFKFDLGKDNLKKLSNELQKFNIDIVIHLAAAKGDFMISDREFYDDNVTATEAIVNLIKTLGVKKVIHYSTVSVYGHNNLRTDEKALLKPNNIYGVTKLKSENIFLDWELNNDVDLTILRPSVIYGVNNYANMYNILHLMNKKFPVSVGKGEYVKSMIALENLIDITLFSINNLSKLQLFNCTDSPYLKLCQVTDHIAEIDGFNKFKIRVPFKLALLLAFPFDVLSSITKIDFKISSERVKKFNTATDYRSILIREKGYVQRYSTKDSLHKMAKWYLEKK